MTSRCEIRKFSEQLLTLAENQYMEGSLLDVPGKEIIPLVTDWSFISCGFDSTDLNPGAWESLLSKFNLEYRGTSSEDTRQDGYVRGYVWANEVVEIVTSNNPITGASNYTKSENKEIDFAGYIGIEGPSGTVGEIAKFILENAYYVKEFEPGVKGFI